MKKREREGDREREREREGKPEKGREREREGEREREREREGGKVGIAHHIAVSGGKSSLPEDDRPDNGGSASQHITHSEPG